MTTKTNTLEQYTNGTRASRAVALGVTLAAAATFVGCAPQDECFTYQKREVCKASADSTSTRNFTGGSSHSGGVFYYGGGGQRVYVPQSELPAVSNAYSGARSSGTIRAPASSGRGFSGGTTRGGFGGTGRGYGGGFS